MSGNQKDTNMQEQGKIAIDGKNSGDGTSPQPKIIEKDVSVDKLCEGNKQDKQPDKTGVDERRRKLRTKYFAKNLVELIVPISVTMVITVLMAILVKPLAPEVALVPILPYPEPKTVYEGFASILVFGCCIIVVTFLLLVLVMCPCRMPGSRMRCGIVVAGCYLCFATFAILTFITSFYLHAVLYAFIIPFDWISWGFLMYNYVVVGMVAIFWKAPALLTRAYTVVNCAMIAIVYTDLFRNQWLVWGLLIFMVLWDIFAVLTPCGPLRMLAHQVRQQRDVKMDVPALVYKAGGVVYTAATSDTTKNVQGDEHDSDEELSENAADQSGGSKDQQAPVKKQLGLLKSGSGYLKVLRMKKSSDGTTDPKKTGKASGPQSSSNKAKAIELKLLKPDQPEAGSDEEEKKIEEDEADHSVYLGLGDFVFYSMLMCAVAKMAIKNCEPEGECIDWTYVLACYVAILIGLLLTVVILLVWNKALPALPISITLGLVFYFFTHLCIAPFINFITYNAVFI